MIVQNISADNTTDFTFTVNEEDAEAAEKILLDMSNSFGGGLVEVDRDIAKISIVGRGMRAHAGIASKMFKTLSDEGINISTISTSEIKISIIVEEKMLDRAVKALHKIFELEKA